MRSILVLLSCAAFAGVPFVASAAGPVPSLSTKDTNGFAPRLVRASKARTLYDQNGNASGLGIVSQNYEAEYDAYDNEAADDFIVPDGSKWKVRQVDVAGTYFDGIGPARSENVVFYRDRKGLPGKVVARFDGVVGEDDGQGSFVIDLGKGVKLKPGHYWLSIQANQDFNDSGQWGWQAREDVLNTPPAWRNPGDGFETGCTAWTTQTVCVPYGQGDQMFALKGKVL